MNFQDYLFVSLATVTFIGFFALIWVGPAFFYARFLGCRVNPLEIIGMHLKRIPAMFLIKILSELNKMGKQVTIVELEIFYLTNDKSYEKALDFANAFLEKQKEKTLLNEKEPH